MITAVREWLTSIVAVAMLLSVAQTLIPEGSVRKISSFTGGLILLVTLLRPVLGADLGRLDLHLEDYEAAVEARREELAETEAAELERIIESRAVAYISDKAAGLGLDAAVRVEAEPGPEGVPVPASAEIEGPRSEELAALIERELGIPRERQVWHESKS